MGHGYGNIYYLDSKNLRFSSGKIVDITHNKIVSIDEFKNPNALPSLIPPKWYFRALRYCLCHP